jgi:hypothetical protein
MRLKKVCASLQDMAKHSLMNLHILILILLNGHKISRPQQQLDTEALSLSATFCEEY